MAKAWSNQDNDFFPVEDNSLTNLLPNSVLKINFSQMQGFWLTELETGKSFQLPEKVYGMERDFIEIAKATWHGTKNNLGILLNGIQGTGKTVTGKILSNELGMPIILLESNLGKGMIDFLGSIQQDVVLFADEYEKIFKATRGDEYNDGEADSTLLTLMDGVMKTQYRKVFLLTTNEPKIHSAMQQRPGRILFTKTFGNLGREVIEEIVADKLVHKHLQEDTIHFIAKLEMITVDIVTSLVTMVNIHNRSLTEFKDILNVKELKARYDVVYVKEDGTEETLAYSQELNHNDDPEKWGEYMNFRTRSTNFGEIEDQFEDLTFAVDVNYSTLSKYRLQDLPPYTKEELEEKKKSGELTGDAYRQAFMALHGQGSSKVLRLKLVPVVSYHASYAHMHAF